MKVRPKSIKATVFIIAIAVIAMIAAKFFGFSSTRSATRIGYIGNEGSSSWSGSYIKLDGTMEKTIFPDGNALSIAVKTESGSISIEIKDTDNNVIFDKDNIGTETFQTAVSGRVTVTIKADDHKGSFNISG